jgi:triosephosphate isomerase (TIM)
MIFVNYKSGQGAIGENALKLTEALKEAQEETSIKIIPVPHDFDFQACFEVWEGEMWAQNADRGYGDTGRNDPETLSDLGVSGVFLNHSEHKFERWEDLELVVDDCRTFGLTSLVFGGTFDEMLKLAQLGPDFIAYEPPELVGSKDTSVARSKPEVIGEVAELAKRNNIPLIVGAGVKDVSDVEVCVRLGASGIAISSAIVNAEDPKAAVLELAGGFLG